MIYKVSFKHQEQSCVYPILVIAFNKLCEDKKKNAICVSGYRSLECQKVTNLSVLNSTSGAVQRADGSVYKDGKCLAAAYGKSNHCYCIALDIDDSWFKDMTNEQLKLYGLYKPMSYEPWHVQLLEHQGITQAQKEQIRNSIINGVNKDMDIKDFQVITGIDVDGKAETMTKNKAKEMLQVCQEILGQNYSSATQTINACMSEPNTWLKFLTSTKYADKFVMNIVDKLCGRK